MVGSTVCNAGLPLYSKVFMISLEPIKVSMKKKRRRKAQRFEGPGRNYIPIETGPCTTANFLNADIYAAGVPPERVSLDIISS